MYIYILAKKLVVFDREEVVKRSNPDRVSLCANQTYTKSTKMVGVLFLAQLLLI
jgi:hypothetical protein